MFQYDSITSSSDSTQPRNASKTGLVVAGIFGITGLATVALATPFVLPAMRKHCLPYVPATDEQLSNLTKAFKKYSKTGGTFVDVGSGDGRICRLAAAQSHLFSQIHGVELNSILVIYSRISSLKSPEPIKYFKKDLWRFPLNQYDCISIFGVESMMGPLERRLVETNSKPQTIFACRFPFSNLSLIEQIGEGIDTVWVYRIDKQIGLKKSRD